MELCAVSAASISRFCSGAIHVIGVELFTNSGQRLIFGMKMRLKLRQYLLMALPVFFLSASAFAIELDEAARQAAKNNNAKVLSARTINQGGGRRTHEIKLLTNKGVVKTVRVPDNKPKKKKKD